MHMHIYVLHSTFPGKFLEKEEINHSTGNWKLIDLVNV